MWGYARVSTTDQDPALQLAALRDAGVSEEHLMIDHTSGAKIDRPGLSDLLERIGPGDTLVVWKLDRLGRSMPDLVTTLNQLGERGVEFRSLTESGMDTTTAQGRLLFGVSAVLAEFERSLNQERTRAGLEVARAQGRIGGGVTVVDEGQAEMVLFLLSQGKSQRAAARATGLSQATVNRLVHGKIKGARLPEHPSLLGDIGTE